MRVTIQDLEISSKVISWGVWWKFRASKCILRVVTRVEENKNLRKVEFLAFFGICKHGKAMRQYWVSEMKNFSNKSCSFWDSWKKSSYLLLGLTHCFASKRQVDITKVKRYRSSRLNGLEKECSSWIKCRLAVTVIKLQKISDHVKSCGTVSQNTCENFKVITQVVLEKRMFKVSILYFWKLCYLHGAGF